MTYELEEHKTIRSKVHNGHALLIHLSLTRDVESNETKPICITLNRPNNLNNIN